MRTKTRVRLIKYLSIATTVLIVISACIMLFGVKKQVAHADTTSFYTFADGNNCSGISFSETDGTINVGGEYSYSKALVIGKTGFDLTDNPSTTIQVLPDVTGTGTNNDRETDVNFTLYFGTLDPATVNKDSFAHNSTNANGFRIRFFINEDLRPQDRVLYEIKTFSQQNGTGEVLRADSTYNEHWTAQADKDGAIDLAYSLNRNIPFKVTVGELNSDNAYIRFDTNRPERTGTLTIPIPKSQMITDSASTLKYYFGYEFFSWNDWTLRTVSASLTAPQVTSTYKITFDANGGSGSMSDERVAGGAYTLPACKFTAPNGKRFKGWSTTLNGEAIQSEAIMIGSDATLYAIWEDIPVVPSDPPVDSSVSFIKINDAIDQGAVQGVSVNTNTQTNITTVSGSQSGNRTLLIYDRGMDYGDVVKTSVKINSDFYGTGTDGTIADYVNFGFYFGTATKGNGFTKDTFSHTRNTGNGFRFRFFSDEGLSVQDPERATFQLKTFTGNEIFSIDSAYNDVFTSSADKEALQDLAWAFTTGEKAIGIEISAEGEILYLKLSVDRTDNPYRSAISVLTISIPTTQFVGDANSTEKYYLAFDFVNTQGTPQKVIRTVNATISQVRSSKASGVTLSPEQITVVNGKNYKITPVYELAGYLPENVIWYSSKTSVATVSQDGTVTGVSVGKAIITINSDGKVATCTVNVIGDLIVLEKEKTVRKGSTYKIGASIEPSSISITYTVGDSTIATVSEDGVITALKEGETTIIIKADNYATKTVKITVVAESPITNDGSLVTGGGGCFGSAQANSACIAIVTVLLGGIILSLSKLKKKNKKDINV